MNLLKFCKSLRHRARTVARNYRKSFSERTRKKPDHQLTQTPTKDTPDAKPPD